MTPTTREHRGHPDPSELLHSDIDPVSVLRRCGRTFYAASLLLPPRTRVTLAELYTFCRMVDDCADTVSADGSATAADLLSAIEADLLAATPTLPAVARLRRLAAEHAMPIAPALELIRGVRCDLASVRMDDVDALVQYAFRVASTVGLMMCRVLGVNPVADRFAIDLGIAMQLTNIARDVREDAQMDRVYLPGSMIASDVVLKATLGECRDDGPGGQASPMQRRLVAEAVRALLDLADRYYDSAELGMRYLPIAVRPGIRAAARNYRAIGVAIRRSPEAVLQGRIATTGACKARGTAVAVVDSLYDLLAVGRERHDATLHHALGPLAILGTTG